MREYGYCDKLRQMWYDFGEWQSGKAWGAAMEESYTTVIRYGEYTYEEHYAVFLQHGHTAAL